MNDPLTVRELIRALSILNPDAEIYIEYDGPDTYTFLRAYGFNVSYDNSRIDIVADPENIS